MLDKTPQVFISYSWSSEKYKQKVLDLAERMMHDGIDVKLDIWDLKEGQDKYVFMEQCVNNPEIDKVLILCDRIYAEKADGRKGGVGDETAIISSKIYGNADQEKFIPVIMERDEKGNGYTPAYLVSRKYYDLTGEDTEDEYEGLLRIIYEEPSQRKPEIGKKPTWLINRIPDDLYKIKSYNSVRVKTNHGHNKVVNEQDFIDLYIESVKKFYVKEFDKDTYLSNFMEMKDYRDVFLDHLRTIFYLDNFGNIVGDDFEYLYNMLYNIRTYEPEANSCNNRSFDIYCVHIWELFISSVVFMLHFEMYQDLHELLARTYFIRNSHLDGEIEACSFVRFRYYSHVIEDEIKPTMKDDLSRKFTLTGHYICTEREYLPIYSGKSIANADLFLYQVYNGLDLEDLNKYAFCGDRWFPTLYVYADMHNTRWKRLTSKRFCEKIMPLFGVNDIDALKKKLDKCCASNEGYRYQGSFDGPPSLLAWVKRDDIATLP